MERSFILVNVVNLLSEVQPLLDINSLMLGKGHTSVANVGSLYAKNLHLFICKDATMKKTAMFAVNVQGILTTVQCSFIGNFRLEKSLTGVVTVGNLLLLFLPSVIIRDLTQEKGLISVQNVGKPLFPSLTFVTIREFILEKDPSSAVFVENLLSLVLLSGIITEFTLEKGLMRVLSVGSPLPEGTT